MYTCCSEPLETHGFIPPQLLEKSLAPLYTEYGLFSASFPRRKADYENRNSYEHICLQLQKLKQTHYEEERLNQNMLHESRNILQGAMADNEFLSDAIKNLFLQLMTFSNTINEAAWNELLRCFKEISTLISNLSARPLELRRVIDEALDYARLKHSHASLHITPIHLHKTLTKIINLFRSQAQQKNIKLVELLPSSETWIQTDVTCLTSIVRNLLSNALKFTPSNGTIIIECQYVPKGVGDNDDKVIIRVKDTGTGMSDEEMALLFTRFSQVNTSALMTHGGSGLGLAIVHEAVKLMNGTINVKSKKRINSGSEFVCQFKNPSLTLAEIEALQAGDEKSEKETKAALVSLSGLSVLLVEDNAVNVKLYEKYLVQLGCKFETVTTGEEALNKYRAGNFNTILLDECLPKRSGAEVLQEIRKKDVEVAIIVISANSSDSFRDTMLQYGASAVLSKPFEKHELRRQLINARRRKDQRPLSPPSPTLSTSSLQSLLELDHKKNQGIQRSNLELFIKEASELIKEAIFDVADLNQIFVFSFLQAAYPNSLKKLALNGLSDLLAHHLNTDLIAIKILDNTVTLTPKSVESYALLKALLKEVGFSSAPACTISC